ncbi:MAG: ACT domain-containing protein [Lachnospiraceae bacterium]
MDDESFFIVKKRAVPEVLLKVVEAKRLLDSERAMTVQEATEQVELSRSSFYKYKDDIFPFHENTRGRTLTFMLQLDDKPGLLSMVLSVLAKAKTNVLTIHQAIPTGGIASITLSIEILPETDDTELLMSHIKAVEGVHYLKILGFE